MISKISRMSSGTKSANFSNPVLWEDLPDPEVFRVGETYYMSASSFHFSPGAPILRSYNLVDWEYIGHSIPELPPSSRFSLDNERPVAYGKGVWASTAKYRESDGLFYFYSAIQGTDKTYVYTAKDPAERWTAHPPIERFYYDLGLLIDDDDTLYMAYGTKSIEVAQLSADGLTEVTSKSAFQVVYTSDEYLEGARMYKINGMYYIWVTKPWDGQYVLKSSGGPFGPYEAREILADMRPPVAGAGAPHQGGLVDTPQGQWYYMAFIDAFPAGRIPVLAPVVFDCEGWPKVIGDYPDTRGQWRVEYPHITTDTQLVDRPATCLRRHDFKHSSLDHCWEWNHNPANSEWSLQDSRLVLKTATVTQSLHQAANTLTHRTIGPGSIATFCVDASELKDGDRAGATLFRDESAYIGIHKDGDIARLVFVDGAKMEPKDTAVGWSNGRPVALDWKWVSNGSIKGEAPLKHSRVWLRIKADVRPVCYDGHEKLSRQAVFEYGYDGTTFTQLGPKHTLSKSLAGFTGHRFGLFNFATRALGGRLLVEFCDIELWNPEDEK
ncbi:ricin b lectin [Colletotrichum truncatum]|uniref:Ricin b lectin n=1 Tax=Colletotrichum truncatum TaxID=5467 RepID=A0ACC3ZHA3_COLTU|nr:ricin b lectin [Colletotrichum truncatum]KAF6781002.1 ricin b lectin [Colletotrichum truncatum]